MRTTLTNVVVDGSNIATEGRSLPSLAQLNEAIETFKTEYEVETLVVVVDATFGHRVEEPEREAYEAAVTAGDLLTPPAGVVGRGDAFVLEIADRAKATVLSNDSFQEFHGTYRWLFDEGRLIGGKPVPGIGWVFVHRVPVRGPVSRRSIKDARDGRRSEPKGSAGRGKGAKRSAKETAGAKAAKDATSAKTETDAGTSRRRSRRRSGGGAKGFINDALPFIEFVGAHPVDSEVEGDVLEFTSHGAYVLASNARCYVPLKAMGDPPPRSPRDVLEIGETRTFLVRAIDTPRRGIDLALASRAAKADIAPSTAATTSEEKTSAEEAPVTPAKKKATKKKATKRPAKKKATKKKATKRPAKKKATKKKATKRPAKKKATKKKATKRPAKRR